MQSDHQQKSRTAFAPRYPGDRTSAWHFAFATTFSALLALAAAIALGIAHPWWAAMTVWLVAQPTRGLLLERSLARLAGSGGGALVGYGLLVIFPLCPLGLLTALTVWIGLCCGAGALSRHFRNYGFVLAGWTAAIVALFGLGDAGHEAPLALGRVAATVLGITAVALMTVALIPANTGNFVAIRLRDLVEHTLEWLSKSSDPHALHQRNNDSQRLFAEIGALEPATDEVAAGSLRGRNLASAQLAALAALVNLLAIGRNPAVVPSFDAANVPAPKFIEEPAQHSRSEVSSKTLIFRLSAFISACRDKPTLASSCATLLRALEGKVSTDHTPRTREWSDAAVAAGRAMLTVILASVAWWVSGWTEAPTMVMTAAMFACLFSGNDHATAAVNDVLRGTIYGALLGIACSLWIWPWAATPTLQLLWITPFLVFGAYLMARRGTSKMAIDLNMTFLLVTRPGMQEAATPTDVTMQAIAIVSGVLIALAMYHCILPASRNDKLVSVARRMACRLESIARSPDHVVIDTLRPLTSDVLRMAVLGDPAHPSSVRLQEQALEVLGVASALVDDNANSVDRNICRAFTPNTLHLVGCAAALRHAAQALSSSSILRRTL